MHLYVSSIFLCMLFFSHINLDQYSIRRHPKFKLQGAMRRLQLKYGFGSQYKKIETNNQAKVDRFSLIRNEILRKFWKKDIVSDLQVELLEIP